MSIITLTTDLGYTDHKVAAIKGSILSLNPTATIIDISHNIQPHNLLETSYIVKNAYHHFPKKSIHIITIDSLYHEARKYLLCFVDSHYFLVPDNGLLHLIFFDIKPESIYEITINNRFDDNVKCSITDIFVPVANHLINGGIPEVIGRKITKTKELSLPKAQYLPLENMIVGEVIYIDHYGNVVSNITKDLFHKHFSGSTTFNIKFRNLKLKKIHQRYTEIIKDYSLESSYHGKQLAIFNEANYLEISIYKGNKQNGAKTLFGLDIGEKIFVEFSIEK